MTKARIRGRELVVLSLETWDQVWRRNQYLVAGLIRADPDLRVLFVEPPADPLHAVTRRARPRIGRGLRQLAPTEGIPPGRCWLYQPTKTLPRRLDSRVDVRRARGTLRAVRSVGFERPLLWFNDPTTASLLDLADLPSLYDVTDDWLAASRSSQEHRQLVHDEGILLDRCTEVTVCSESLAASKGVERKVTVITNGVDLARYRAPAERPNDLPSGRTAVYVGTLHSDRLDVELCRRTARALGSAASIVLVGPVALTPSEIENLMRAGVVILGPRDYMAVPGYLQHADVLLVPHVVDRFTDSLDPIKLYEYRSVGRPVISTPVAGFRDVAAPTIVTTDASAFPDTVAELLRLPRRATVDPPSDLPTWESQSRLFGLIIDRAYAGRIRGR